MIYDLLVYEGCYAFHSLREEMEMNCFSRDFTYFLENRFKNAGRWI